MKKGVVLFAHNNRQIDYAKMALVSGGLAKKNLGVPVSLVTDQSTIDWLKESNLWNKALETFEQIIDVERPTDLQQRKFKDGKESVTAPFKNSNRSSVWDLTPYDRTLMIDCDYFIFSDALNEYWDCNSDILISTKYNDVQGERIGYLDKHISDTGVRLLWATTVMFTKNENTKVFFELVKHIKDNYKKFADIFRFDSRMYRNDISFGIARHILYGFETDNDYAMPPVLSVPDMDLIYDVNKNGIQVLTANLNDYTLCNVKDRDIHIMNKQSITRHIDKFMELV